MALSPEAAEAERVLELSLAQADANVQLRSRAGKIEAREILEMLERADRELRRRLEREARRFGPTERFTGAGLLAYQRQTETVMNYVRGRMGKLSRKAARRNIREGWNSTVDLLDGLEHAYSGVVRPLRIDSARMMNERTRGIRASLMRQHATSMDRYGGEMERAMRQTLQTNLLAGGSFSQAVDQLVRLRGPRGEVSVAARELGDGTVERTRLETIPEGLFKRHRWWAARIIRTETAYAQNGAAHEAIVASRDEDFPDMQKKILAVMDNRTFPDSIAVHGQIRDVDKTFRDGAGREYLHPPARPNDREVVIPWRPHWDETPTSEPSELEQAVARAREMGEVVDLRDVPLHERLIEETEPHGLGGAGEKTILRDPVTGQRYLFKVAQAKSGGASEPFRAHAQVAFSQVAQQVRTGGHLNVEAFTHQGRFGTLQPMLDLADPPDFRAGRVQPRDLSPEDALQVAEEHVLDFAMSQHDTHSENIVRTRDGRILSIDKEQGWRYFPNDELSTSYQPNTDRYGEEAPYYNRFWTEFEAGNVDFDPQQMSGALDRLSNIDSAELRRTFAPYAASRPDLRTVEQQEAWVTRAVNRVHTTRDHFEEFVEQRYRNREGNRGTFTFAEGWTPAAPDVSSPYSSPTIDDAVSYAREELAAGRVTGSGSRFAGGNTRHALERARMLRGVRRLIGGEHIGPMSDAMISHWAGRSTDGAASLAVEALSGSPENVQSGWWPRPPMGRDNDAHHQQLLTEGAGNLNQTASYAGAFSEGEATAATAVQAAEVQLAATRALIEHEGISQPGQTHRVIRGVDRGLADVVRGLVRDARAAGHSHVRVPTRALASTAVFSEPSATRSGTFGPVILDIDLPHEGIFSHFDVDGELLHGEAEIVAIFPDGHVEVAVNRIYDRDAGERIPRRNQASPPAPEGAPLDPHVTPATEPLASTLTSAIQAMDANADTGGMSVSELQEMHDFLISGD